MTYDWIAALAYIATLVVLTIVGKKLVFSIPVMEEMRLENREVDKVKICLLYTSPSPRDQRGSRMPSSA